MLKDKVSHSERILVNNVQVVSRLRTPSHFGIEKMLVRAASGHRPRHLRAAVSVALGEGACPVLWVALPPSRVSSPPPLLIYSFTYLLFSFLRTKIIFDLCSMLR